MIKLGSVRRATPAGLCGEVGWKASQRTRSQTFFLEEAGKRSQAAPSETGYGCLL